MLQKQVLAYKRNINNLLLNRFLRENLSLKTHMSVSFIYRYIGVMYTWKMAYSL